MPGSQSYETGYSVPAQRPRRSKDSANIILHRSRRCGSGPASIKQDSMESRFSRPDAFTVDAAQHGGAHDPSFPSLPLLPPGLGSGSLESPRGQQGQLPATTKQQPRPKASGSAPQDAVSSRLARSCGHKASKETAAHFCKPAVPSFHTAATHRTNRGDWEGAEEKIAADSLIWRQGFDSLLGLFFFFKDGLQVTVWQDEEAAASILAYVIEDSALTRLKQLQENASCKPAQSDSVSSSNEDSGSSPDTTVKSTASPSSRASPAVRSPRQMRMESADAATVNQQHEQAEDRCNAVQSVGNSMQGCGPDRVTSEPHVAVDSSHPSSFTHSPATESNCLAESQRHAIAIRTSQPAHLQQVGPSAEFTTLQAVIEAPLALSFASSLQSGSSATKAGSQASGWQRSLGAAKSWLHKHLLGTRSDSTSEGRKVEPPAEPAASAAVQSELQRSRGASSAELDAPPTSQLNLAQSDALEPSRPAPAPSAVSLPVHAPLEEQPDTSPKHTPFCAAAPPALASPSSLLPAPSEPSSPVALAPGPAPPSSLPGDALPQLALGPTTSAPQVSPAILRDSHPEATCHEGPPAHRASSASLAPEDRQAHGYPGPRLQKYWNQRYRLWSRYDEGVRMDEHGWYTVTPEAIAQHQARRLLGKVVVDGFAGCGGNIVAMARSGAQRVVAIDTCQQRLEHTLHNARVYGVDARVETRCADFFQVAPELEADSIFMSPPWGGPEYERRGHYDVSSAFPGLPVNLAGLILAAREGLRPDVHDGAKHGTLAIFLPRSTSRHDIRAAIPVGVRYEIEESRLRPMDPVKGLTVYVWF